MRRGIDGHGRRAARVGSVGRAGGVGGIDRHGRRAVCGWVECR